MDFGILQDERSKNDDDKCDKEPYNSTFQVCAFSTPCGKSTFPIQNTTISCYSKGDRLLSRDNFLASSQTSSDGCASILYENEDGTDKSVYCKINQTSTKTNLKRITSEGLVRFSDLIFKTGENCSSSTSDNDGGLSRTIIAIIVTASLIVAAIVMICCCCICEEYDRAYRRFRNAFIFAHFASMFDGGRRAAAAQQYHHRQPHGRWRD